MGNRNSQQPCEVQQSSRAASIKTTTQIIALITALVTAIAGLGTLLNELGLVGDGADPTLTATPPG